MHAGSVDQHDLSALAPLLLGDIDDAKDAIARSLRLGRNDRQLLADQRIEQRALASIGTAKDADESGVKGHGYRLLVLAVRS